MGKLRQTIGNIIAGSPDKALNAADVPLGQQFLRYGNRGTTDLSDISWMSDKDLYKGMMYAAIRNRANRVAQLATENLKTEAEPKVMDAAKRKDEEVRHPYLDLIDASTTFSNYRFWYEASTFIDLEGVYYLMAVRTVQGERIGNIKEFKLLNPFNIKRLVKETNGSFELVGYRETRGSWTRDLPKELIIEMRDLNPFSDTEPLSLADAARDQQYILQEAGRYTRKTLKKNIKRSGIISTNIVMSKEQLANFKASVMNSAEDGEPIFTDGAGGVTWDPMTIDMDKAALDKINATSVETMLAVTGMSKTTMGIEVSGVTRDTSKVQSDLLISGHAMPRLQLMADALNQDYKTYYKTDYVKNQYRITIDSPLGTDREAELKDVEIRQSSYDLFTSLIDKGFDSKKAAAYADGRISLEELGAPTKPAVQPPALPAPQTQSHRHDEVPDVIRNAMAEAEQATVRTAEAGLRNTVINVEQRVVATVLGHVTNNAYDSKDDIITEAERARYEEDLRLALAVFYQSVVPLWASAAMNRRLSEFQLPGVFAMTIQIREELAAMSTKAALSHITTITDDLLAAVRAAALDGANQSEIAAAVRQQYGAITDVRAKTIARSETNRAFSVSQFEADKQFLEQNELTGQAFKRWITRSADPCVFCRAKAAEPPIPFDQPFAEMGDVVTVTEDREDGSKVVRKLPISYETVLSGDIHPNGSCGYVLIIEGL